MIDKEQIVKYAHASIYTDRMWQETVPIRQIRSHPDNPNLHDDEQIDKLVASDEHLGQFRSVILWKRPDGYIQVAGHGYLLGRKRRGHQSVRAEILPEDTPAQVALEILLADNGHGRNSHEDASILARVLESLRQEDVPLEAMGYTDAQLDKLLDDLESEPLPSPGDAETETVPESWGVVIECRSEFEQVALLERLQGEGYQCRALVL